MLTGKSSYMNEERLPSFKVVHFYNVKGVSTSLLYSLTLTWRLVKPQSKELHRYNTPAQLFFSCSSSISFLYV